MDDIVTYLQTAASNLPGIQWAILVLAGFVGVVAVSGGLIHQATQGRRNGPVLPGTIGAIIGGSLMLSLPMVVGVTGISLFGDAHDPKLITSYVPEAGSDNVRLALQALVAFINVIGWYAVARGINRWKNGPKYDQPGWFWSGMTFVVAGTLAANFYVFADMLGVSVGAMPVGTNYFKF
jgi:hypothetical protein